MADNTQWWENPDQYHDPVGIPSQMYDYTLNSDNKPAVVEVYAQGKTSPGWGNDKFMANYLANWFTPQYQLAKFTKNGTPFAIIMRSLRLLCVDIDGKNGGIETARLLDLPPTLAETSKSGNGYHLYYEYQDTWDPNMGFQGVVDRISMWDGIDIKSTGVVYHYTSQRWNRRPITQIPEKTFAAIQAQRERDDQVRITPDQVIDMDPEERQYRINRILLTLQQPSARGHRDPSLWRAGASLRNLGVPDDYIAKAITEAGLRWGVSEPVITDKIIPNILSYAPKGELP